MLGMARILFIRENYTQALTFYRNVLKIQPDCIPNPRIGMGLCFYKLGMTEAARQAFERCIELNSHDSTAHVLLAVVDFNMCKHADLSEEEIKDCYKAGFIHLRNAYSAEKKNPVVGLYMGRHFAIIQDPEKALAFATKASNAHGLKNVQSEGFYVMGRIHHQQDRYVEALACYGKAVSFNSDNLLAQFGLGQTLLFKQDVAGAISAFERILSKEPKCVEAIAVRISFTVAVLYTCYMPSQGSVHHKKEMKVMKRQLTCHFLFSVVDSGVYLFAFSSIQEQSTRVFRQGH